MQKEEKTVNDTPKALNEEELDVVAGGANVEHMIYRGNLELNEKTGQMMVKVTQENSKTHEKSQFFLSREAWNRDSKRWIRRGDEVSEGGSISV